MKRILATLLACALLLSCVSLAVADEKKTLTVWIPQYQFGDGISDQDFWDGVFDPFEAENNCEVKVEILPWGDYNTTIYTGLLNNDGPDVVYVTDNYDLVKAGLLLGLDSYLTEEQKDNYLLWAPSLVDAQEPPQCVKPLSPTGGAEQVLRGLRERRLRLRLRGRLRVLLHGRGRLRPGLPRCGRVCVLADPGRLP